MVKLIAYSRGVNGEMPEDILTLAFSQCYQTKPNIQAVIRNIKHQSVLEHVTFTFDVQMSRVSWEQLVRHRIASFTAQSHRYTEIKEEDFYFYIPDEIRSEDIDEWIADLKSTYRIYKKWQDKGYKKETARYQASKGVSIKATVSFNLRSLLNLLALRTDSHAQEEIRKFAEEVWQQVKPLFPQLQSTLEGSFRR